MISSWKGLGLLENDYIVDKIEKFRRGNSFDRKKRGLVVNMLSNRF